MKTRSVFTLIPITLVFFLCSCLSSDYLPTQTGVFSPLGTSRFVLDDPRGLVVQTWYPAADAGEGKIDPVIQKEQARAWVSFLPISKKELERNLPSKSYIDAPVRTADRPYPVIIFDHGYEGFEKQNVSQMEYLASHGYVVFSINHPGESFVTVYPDGSVVYMDNRRYPSLYPKTRKERDRREELTRKTFQIVRDSKIAAEQIETIRLFSSFSYVSHLAVPVSERVRDVKNFMERLPNLNRSALFRGTMDLDRVGMYGHSMGGSVSFILGSENRDSLPVNLRAVANLDGPQLIFPGQSLTVPGIPALQAYSTGAYTGSEVINLSGSNDWILQMSGEETWRAVFYGSTHANFTDLTYLEFMEGVVTGFIDGSAMGDALNRLLLAWFDRHLKNIEVDMVELNASYGLWRLGYSINEQMETK